MLRIQQIQSILGVDADGVAGPITRNAFDLAASETHRGIASTFADMGDLKRFAKCKGVGKTDRECFAIGDNGVGASGRVTAQQVDPMVALHPIDIRLKWGTMQNGWGKKVRIAYGLKTCEASVEDFMSSPKADIDLNPAAVSALGVPEGGMVSVIWEWV